jgi:molybdenum-dependent DNA-binding transcriptional regulator ModE
MSNSLSHDQLLRIVRSVRNRWRLKIILRGLGIALVGALVVFGVSAFGIDKFHFNPTAVLVFRIVAYLLIGGLLLRFTILPLLRHVSDDRVALYLEEHEPSLDGRLVSAIEFGGRASSGQHSHAFIEHLVTAAVEQCEAADNGRKIDRKPLLQSSGLLAGATAMGMVVLLFGPTSLRLGTRALLTPWESAEERSPYAIEVLPGDTTVARGSDLRLTAQLQNFDSDRVELAARRSAESQWERWPMTVDEATGDFAFLLFDLGERTEYYVESAGVRSQVFEIDVADLPHVQQIDLEYHFPAYTRRQPRREEDGGDVAAIRGTRVEVNVTPTIPVDWGALLLDEQDTIALAVDESGALTGQFRVQRDGFYRILFTTAAGKIVPGSGDYVIDALVDQAPTVVIREPGRDLRVTNIEEIFTEIEAEDDYGVQHVELNYSVNGGPEETVVLFEGTAARKQLTAGHTFFLEELNLQPGDLVAYYARATDSDRVTGPHEAVTDIYFLNVRPFEREYRQAEQQAAGGMGAGLNSALSERQRQIVAATFNLVRDRSDYSEKEYNENLATLALAQGRLRDEVETLLGRIRNRGVIALDTSFAQIAAALEEAVRAMQAAEEELGKREPGDALPREQQALQQLQRAEAVFREVQVSRGSGGGGGGGSANAEELADLFDLEMDKLRNQYEQVQRGQREAADAELDELMQKLQELSRRQQQENERMRARANQMQQPGGGGGGGNQRQLAEEAEELARRLERLAREQRTPELERTAQELREAAEQMRRAASNSNSDAGVGRGQSALDRLREARQFLDDNRNAGLQREIDDALRRAQRLSEMQQRVTEQVEELDPGDGGETMGRLLERKEQMAAEVRDLEQQLDRLAQETRREQPEASRNLGEAAGGIRDSKLREKILYSRGVVQGRSREYAQNFEEQIGVDLEALQERIQRARDAMGDSSERRLVQGLDRTRDLVNALESLDARLRDRAQQGEQGQQGQGQQGERGQQGQGQQGERGQQGQQGQQGQGDQQGEARGAREGPGGPVTAGGPGGFTPGDARQFRRELRQRVGEADALRRELRTDGVDVSDLENIIARLRALDDRLAYGDPRALAQLRTEVIQGLKEFEYGLRRELLGDESQRLILGGSEEVPDGYRELVEEYYKALSERRP